MKNQNNLTPKYGILVAISMVVGQVIGSGIFFKVDDVLMATQGNVYAGLMGFLVVGIGVIFAALSMANYAEILPHEGGILSYVEYRFGKKPAAYVGWLYLALFYPLLAAVLLTVSGIYIAHFIADFIHFKPNFFHYSLIGLCNGVLFLLLNIFKPKSSGGFLQLATILKLLPLIFIAALGIINLFDGQSQALQNQVQPMSGDATPFWVLVMASFIPISFSMDGWYAVTQIAGEVKNSQKNLPRALLVGTIIVLLVYVFYYWGIVSEMSVAEIEILRDTYIAEFSRKTGGEIGAMLMQLFIIISVLGTCNGLMLATIRVPYQFYNLEHSKKFWDLGKIDPRTQMPMNSAFLAFGIIVFYLLVFHLTNVLPFFTERQYDISAVPISFIYFVNTCLFLGLFKLIKANLFKGNKTGKYLMLIIAIMGNAVVLIGTFMAPNGWSYFVLAMIFGMLGRLFVKK